MLKVRELYKSYSKSLIGLKKARLNILDGISFQIHPGEWVALVGESGSGKSTLSRLVLGLEKADSGQVWLEGRDVSSWIKENKGQISIVFQDYTSSVNPGFRVKDIISEPLMNFNRNIYTHEAVESLLEKVGLPFSIANRYPHELSGGQLQRVCIARAISTKPRFIILDEAISSFDITVQYQILELLHKLKKELHMTCLFITHDLQTVTYLCDKVLFLNQGQIVERIETNNLVDVKSEYAKKMLESVIGFTV